MRLELPYIDGEENFYRFYIPSILKDLLKGLNAGRKYNIEEYLKDNFELNITYNKIIDDIVDSIVIIISSDKCYYSINNIELIENKIGVNSIINTINYGSLELRGTNIFTKVYQYIEKNYTKLLRKYKKQGRR